MKRFIVLVTAIAGTIISTASNAQSRGGHVVEVTDAQAQVTTNAFAACVVKRSPGVAARLASLPAGSATEAKAASDMASNYCVGMGDLQFHPMMLRGGIFEAMYRRDFARAEPANMGNRAAVNYATSAAGPDARAFVPLLIFADCVARTNPSASRAVILSAVTTQQERTAFGALGGALSTCLPNGQTLKFSRVVLRGYLAEALYNLSKAPEAGKAGT